VSRLGIVLPPQDPELGAPDLVELAQLAERSGYDSVFLPEAWSWDAMCVLTAIAAATSRVELGSAVVTLPVRTPALTAMAALTVDSISGGRCILGLGTGHRRLITQWHGLDFQPRLGKLREYIQIVRGIHAGEHMAYEGRYYRCADAELGVEPVRKRIPIYLAALHLDTMRLAGELADGLLPYYATPDWLARGIAAVAEGAERARRDPAEVEIALMVPTWVTDDVAAAREVARGQIAWYNNFEFYNRMFFEAGFEAEATALRETWARIDADPELKRRWEESRDKEGSDAGTAALVSDAMVDSIFVIGTAAECRARIDAMRALGVGMPLVFPQGVHGDRASARAGFAATIEGLAPAAA
jgi:alkanesulfonate monooxygenase SsuD/methylene tetrahydromethanopterin reductase-like flavin-dependent oxidoreductase (luciferase family)